MSKTERVQRDLDTVVDVMKSNIGKVIERQEKLEDIEERSEVLLEGATAFRTGARRVQRKYWWQHIKVLYFYQRHLPRVSKSYTFLNRCADLPAPYV